MIQNSTGESKDMFAPQQYFMGPSEWTPVLHPIVGGDHQGPAVTPSKKNKPPQLTLQSQIRSLDVNP